MKYPKISNESIKQSSDLTTEHLENVPSNGKEAVEDLISKGKKTAENLITTSYKKAKDLNEEIRNIMQASETKSLLFAGVFFASIVAGYVFNVIKNEREKTSIMQQEKKMRLMKQDKAKRQN